MTVQQPTWAIVATVDEPPALVQAFVAWHLALGAAEVMLYFDRPDDPAADLFGGQGAVSVVRCDDGHWARTRRRRPERHQIRQLRNATDAYARMQSDWLLHADTDEYLWPVGSVRACLDAAYPWTDCLVVPVVERILEAGAPVSTVFSGAFRRPFPKDSAADGLTLRGVTGHAVGKAFTRKDRDVEISIHRPRALKHAASQAVTTERAQGVELLHFDGLTPLNWVYKLLRKADAVANHNGMAPSAHRQMQIDAVVGDPAAAFALHDRLKVGDAKMMATLEHNQLLRRADFASAIAAAMPADLKGLTPAAVDDWLWQQKGPLLAQYGLIRT